MKPEIIVEGKNVEEALKIAAVKYNINIEKIKYDVISYGSTGIFGLVGVKKAKIRINNIEENINSKREQKEEINCNMLKDEKESVKTKEKRKDKDHYNGKESALNTELEEENIQNRCVLPKELEKFEKDPIGLGKEILGKIIEMISPQNGIEIEAKKEDEVVVYNVKGGKPAVIIGKRGQTLEAIQYLIEKIINRISEKRIRLQIDIEGYLKNRKENLEQLAKRLAEKAIRIGKPVTVGEMNVHDRKIVHMVLKEHRQVRTQSMGSGFYRKLMIFPKKSGGKKEEKENNIEI